MWFERPISAERSGPESDLLGPSRTFSDLLGPSRTFSDLLGPSRTFSDLLGPSRTFSDLLGPSRTFSDLLGPSRTCVAEAGLAFALANDCLFWGEAGRRAEGKARPGTPPAEATLLQHGLKGFSLVRFRRLRDFVWERAGRGRRWACFAADGPVASRIVRREMPPPGEGRRACHRCGRCSLPACASLPPASGLRFVS